GNRATESESRGIGESGNRGIELANRAIEWGNRAIDWGIGKRIRIDERTERAAVSPHRHLFASSPGHVKELRLAADYISTGRPPGGRERLTRRRDHDCHGASLSHSCGSSLSLSSAHFWWPRPGAK